MKKKYFAVKKGIKTGVFYDTWDNIQPLVQGYSGAEFKSFITKREAQEFLGQSVISKNNQKHQRQRKVHTHTETYTKIQKDSSQDVDSINSDINTKIDSLDKQSVIVFTDGSYNKSTQTVGWGNVILTKNNNNIDEQDFWGSISNVTETNTRNVLGELVAAKNAVKWAIASNYKKITIYHDYIGVSAWATNKWKTNIDLTKEYKQYMKYAMNKININFVKVPAHSNVTYNEKVDMVAKKGAGVI